MKNYLIIFYALLVFTSGCSIGGSGKKTELKVFENNHTFSIPEIKLKTEDTFSFLVSNGLKAESFEFVVLNDGEDPILVQHLYQQSGELPESYYLFKSRPIEPGQSERVKFKTPSEPGRYHYVALSGSPKDSLFGTLIIESDVEKVVGDNNDSKPN